MIESSLVEVKMNREEVLDDVKLDNIVGGDLFSRLEIDLQNDVLIKILKEFEIENEIINDSMREILKENTLYSTTAASRILDIPSSTLRGWIKELDDYVNPIIVGNTYKLDAKAVYKLSMINILRNTQKYAIGYIKSITLGTEVIDDGETKEKSLNEKVEELANDNENMKQIIKKMAQNIDVTQTILMDLIDKDAFNNSGDILLNSNKFTNLLESKESVTYDIDEKINNNLQKVKTDLSNELNSKIENLIKQYNRKFEIESNIESNSRISSEEIKAYSAKLKQKTIWEKIFGIKLKK